MPKRTKIYYYNDHALVFEEAASSRKTKVRHVLVYSFIILLVSGLSGCIFYHYGLAPEKIMLTKKMSFLEAEMARLASSCDSMELLLAGIYFPQDNYYRTILGIDTLPVSIRTAGTGGHQTFRGMTPELSLSLEVSTQINQLRNQASIHMNSLEMLQETALLREQKHTAIPAIEPIAHKDLTQISSCFGKRIDPFVHEEVDHFGLDFVAPCGTMVYSTGDGTVTLLKFSRTGYGNELVINHSFGYSTRYAHLDTFFVKEGEPVKRGQLIGVVGNSGRSTGPHLHYEVRYEGKPVNPAFYYSNDLTDDEFHLLTNTD